MFEWFKNLFGSCCQSAEIAPVTQKAITYILNDPTTPKLSMQLLPPVPTAELPFTVMGYKGGGFAVNSIEGQAANDFVTIANSIKLVQSYASKPIKRWAATRNLTVVPRAGKDLNAYYDRRSLQFFFISDPVLHKTVYAADSADVVAHELGHGLLDCQKPELWNAQTLEGMGFHEAYGDINAILAILNYKPILEYVLKETNNDLRKDNIVARLAEEMGVALADLTGTKRKGGLRDAINNFVYTPPERLPQDGPDEKLTGECHSFGRLFLGAWYEVLVNLYEKELKTKKPMEALIAAKDAAGIYLHGGIAQAPIVSNFYNAVASGMVSYALGKKKDADAKIVQDVFQKRKIIQPKLLAMSNMSFADLKLKANDEIVRWEDRNVVIQKKTHKVKLAEHLGLTAMADNPLFHLEIEIPGDACYHFNKKGMLVSEIKTTWDEAVQAARASLVYLHTKNLVSGGPYKNDPAKTIFEVKDGKLLRTKFID